MPEVLAFAAAKIGELLEDEAKGPLSFLAVVPDWGGGASAAQRCWRSFKARGRAEEGASERPLRRRRGGARRFDARARELAVESALDAGSLAIIGRLRAVAAARAQGVARSPLISNEVERTSRAPSQEENCAPCRSANG